MLMAVGLTYGILFGQSGVSRYFDLRGAFVERSAMVQARVTRNELLRDRLEGLRTSDEVLEEIARIQLSVVAEDEIVYVYADR